MMPGFWQIIIIIVLVVLLFGRNKISDLMGDVAKGIKSFKKGLADDDDGGADDDKKLASDSDSETVGEAEPVKKESANT